MTENTKNKPKFENEQKIVAKGAIKKALIISSQKWNSVLKNLNKDDETKKQIQKEDFKEYLKNESEKIKSKWPRNIFEKTPEVKRTDQKQKYKEKILKDEEQFKEYRRIEANNRQEKIDKAKVLISQMKAESRELDSAAMCSEIIKGREIQKAIKVEFEKILKENEKKEEEKNQIQNEKWIKEEQDKIIEKKKRNEKYRDELQKQIEDEKKLKTENAKRYNEYEKILKEKQEKEVEEQIKREKIILQRKKEAMRKNALEAMKMMEQRRLREKMEENIETEIIEIFNEGKQNVTKIIKEKEKELQMEKMKKVEENAKKVISQKNQNLEKEEAQRLKAMEEFRIKMDTQEKEKIEKAKRRKAERIKACLEEMEREKVEKKKKQEELKWNIANRIKNEEVNQEYFGLRSNQEKTKVLEFKSIISQQMQEKKLREMQKKEIENLCSTDYTSKEENEFFMNYSNRLVKVANKKQRPIWPIVKAVERYKKRNNIGTLVTEARHLKSNIPIEQLECACKPTIKPVIKYDLNELKQLNPVNASVQLLWA